MTAPPLAALQRVSVTHLGADRPSPHEVSLAIRPGEVVMLLGPSGSGKSTLTLTLNGLIPHALDADVDGVVRIDGSDVAATVPARLSTRVGMVFQDPDAQIVTSSVLDEVAFGLENLLLPAPEVLRRSEAALRRMGLWERRHDDPAVLSGGGRQRLAIACALAMRAPLLVLDEPTATLDVAGTAEVYAALAELAASGEHAILLIEHDVDAALPLATRIVALDHDGRIAFEGEPHRVLSEHADDLRALGVWLPDDAEGSGAPWDGGPGGAAIAAHGLTVTRDRRPVLHDVSIEIPAGSFTAIVGPNGAGKTTLAQALAGVIATPRGTVRVGGLDARTAGPRRLAEHVGFVFQNPEHQFVAHTVRGELEHSLRHVAAHDRERRVAEALDRFGLAGLEDRHPFRLSGGQKRRLSVATALIAGADRPGGVIVLDEPTYGQDRARADELLALLRELHDHGTTIVVVTHDLRLVGRHATHTAVIDDGRVVAFGRTTEALPVFHSLVSTPPLRASAQPVSAPSGRSTTRTPRSSTGAAQPRSGDGPSAGGTAAEVEASPRARNPAPLERLNPLAKLAAIVPALVGLVFARDILTPVLFLALAYAVVLLGAPRTRRAGLWLGLTLPAIVLTLAAGFTLWTDAATGTATALRLAALLGIALIPGLTTEGPEVVRAMVAQLRVPYRVGYAALAAYRFVPRLRHERAVIRAARRVRGGGAWITRAAGSLIPLLAGAIRHAERVALAMDSRAFGAYPERTERHPVRWRRRDSGTVAIGWALTVAVFVTGALAGGFS